ncbi:hypothetical protein GCM10010269_66740 [Streptomyces humidus]|uniref:Uncharacterized protein n=1 Tax=Streptomyces humidus TaxID=52259 RepID=A0A918G511_9ACTN|nr:hypothetical protein GCM10010269_66740 [Streptomyces humidus]
MEAEAARPAAAHADEAGIEALAEILAQGPRDRGAAGPRAMAGGDVHAAVAPSARFHAHREPAAERAGGHPP